MKVKVKDKIVSVPFLWWAYEEIDGFITRLTIWFNVQLINTLSLIFFTKVTAEWDDKVFRWNEYENIPKQEEVK